MENREELQNKMPFYMSYPMQNLYLAEMEYEKDLERMREMYPREVQRLQRLIEERCDELEQEGSRMYDENPDRQMMEEEVRRLLERFLRENPQFGMTSPRPMEPQRPMEPMRPEQVRPEPRRYRIVPPEEYREMMPETRIYGTELEAQNRRDCDNPWLCHLMSVLFNDEVYRRRCRYRRCRRWW